jgi:hypothetical protein
MYSKYTRLYGAWFKIPLELVSDIATKQAMINDRIIFDRYIQLRKGIRLMNVKVNEGWDGMDFVDAQYTIAIRYDMYKIPRIIKHYLQRHAN